LYGCENWSLTLREEHKLRVFENRVLRKIFGFETDEMIREWRKVQNVEVHNLYSSSDIIRMMKSRKMRWSGCVARLREMRNTTFWPENVMGREHSENLDIDGGK
jgi:hypothetical protein